MFLNKNKEIFITKFLNSITLSKLYSKYCEKLNWGWGWGCGWGWGLAQPQPQPQPQPQ